MSPPLLDWVLAFVWTSAIELFIYDWALKRFYRAWWAGVAATLAVNLCTHPALWYLVPQFPPYWLWLVVAECGVTAVETILIFAFLSTLSTGPRPSRRAAMKWALIAAGLANLSSTVFGLGVGALFWGD